MKLYTKIISILLVAGLASAGAQSVKNFYVKGAVGYADLDSGSGLSQKTKGFNPMSGMDLKLDSATSFSLEGGMYFGEKLSFGFEWTTFDSDAQARRNFTNFPALQSGIGSEWDLGVGLNAFEEEIDVNRFMFVLNYEHFFNDQFSLLINTGLGILDVEQKIKVYEVSPRVERINSKADETSLAYQVGLSLGYHFNESFSIYGGGRYLGGSKVDFKHKLVDGGTTSLSDFSADAIVYEVGATYNF